MGGNLLTGLGCLGPHPLPPADDLLAHLGMDQMGQIQGDGPLWTAVQRRTSLDRIQCMACSHLHLHLTKARALVLRCGGTRAKMLSQPEYSESLTKVGVLL